MKPADELRNATGFDPLGMEDAAQKAAALLDKCERVLGAARGKISRLIVDGGKETEGTYREWFGDIDDTLDKLRGEA